jgi:hypothetical protein
MNGTSMRTRKRDDFRRNLLERFGVRCVIAGPQPAEVLQAAHLQSFANEPTSSPGAGLLLRADLHLLFDAGLLDIRPDLTISISSALEGFPEIRRFHGRRLEINESDPYYTETCECLRRRTSNATPS